VCAVLIIRCHGTPGAALEAPWERLRGWSVAQQMVAEGSLLPTTFSAWCARCSWLMAFMILAVSGENTSEPPVGGASGGGGSGEDVCVGSPLVPLADEAAFGVADGAM